MITEWIRCRQRPIALAAAGMAVFMAIVVLKPEWVWWFQSLLIRVFQPALYADLVWCEENLELCRQVGTPLLPKSVNETPEAFLQRSRWTLIAAAGFAAVLLWAVDRALRWFEAQRRRGR